MSHWISSTHLTTVNVVHLRTRLSHRHKWVDCTIQLNRPRSPAITGCGGSSALLPDRALRERLWNGLSRVINILSSACPYGGHLAPAPGPRRSLVDRHPPAAPCCEVIHHGVRRGGGCREAGSRRQGSSPPRVSHDLWRHRPGPTRRLCWLPGLPRVTSFVFATCRSHSRCLLSTAYAGASRNTYRSTTPHLHLRLTCSHIYYHLPSPLHSPQTDLNERRADSCNLQDTHTSVSVSMTRSQAVPVAQQLAPSSVERTHTPTHAHHPAGGCLSKCLPRPSRRVSDDAARSRAGTSQTARACAARTNAIPFGGVQCVDEWGQPALSAAVLHYQ